MLAQLRSPYVDPQNADPFYCSKEVCDIYDAVCQHSTPRTRSKGKLTDNSRNELTNSMAPEKEMDNLVVETAIISSRGPEIRPNKRNKAKEENNATTNSYILPEQLFQQE